MYYFYYPMDISDCNLSNTSRETLLRLRHIAYELKEAAILEMGMRGIDRNAPPNDMNCARPSPELQARYDALRVQVQSHHPALLAQARKHERLTIEFGRFALIQAQKGAGKSAIQDMPLVLSALSHTICKAQQYSSLVSLSA